MFPVTWLPKTFARLMTLAAVLALLTGCAGAATALPPTLTPVLPTPTPIQPTPTTEPAPRVMLAGGAGHTCLLALGRVQCWGAAQFGQIGVVADGAFSITGKPVTVSGLPGDVVAIAAGAYHTCALMPSQVWCWGRDETGVLGEGATGDSPAPRLVAGAPGGLAMDAGIQHTCVLTGGREVWCWGSNNTGQLGGGSAPVSAKPVKVEGLTGEVGMLALGLEFSCALNENGGVQCWGAGQSGQLGSGALANSAKPVDVVDLPGPAKAIAAGSYHACALLLDGSVWCWGGGAEPDPANPRMIAGLPGPAVALAAGDGHTCALLNNRLVQCWGDNYFGQLGLSPDQSGTGMPSRGKPVALPEAISALGIAAGTNHTCALVADGSVHCWGDLSSGQGGDGSLRWK